MARTFTKNTSNYLSFGLNGIGNLLNGASQISLHCRVKMAGVDTGANDNVALFGFCADGFTGLRLMVNATGANRVVKMAARSVSGDSLQSSTGTTDIALGDWVSIGAVVDFTAATICLYLNGGCDGVTSGLTFANKTYTVAACTGVNTDTIGTTGTSFTTVAQLNGDMADCLFAVGDIGGEWFARLAEGSTFLPPGTVFYTPLGNTSPEVDQVSSVSGTITGSLPVVQHPFVNDSMFDNAGWLDALLTTIGIIQNMSCLYTPSRQPLVPIPY